MSSIIDNIASMTVLVTGGAGFIGSELVRQLAEKGCKVIIVDNLVNGKRENVEEILSDKVILKATDIRDTERMNELLEDTDIVFHLACLGVRHSIHSPFENHEVNATATLNLLAAAREKSVKRFIYISSSEVYGTAIRVPMPEDHPTYPMTVYGSSKLAGECYTRAYYRTYNYPTVVIRPFNAFGPRSHHEGDSGEVIPKFLLRSLSGKPMVIFGDGTQTRDFTFVSDTARGIIEVGCSDKALGETFNLGNGREITVNELAEQIAKVSGSSAETIYEIQRPGDVLRLYADMTKAYELTGFKPTITLKEGLSRLKDWYVSLDSSPEQLLEQEKVRNWE